MTRALDRSGVPELSTPVEARLPPFTRVWLSNGLEVALAETRALPLVALQLVVRAGAGLDPPPLAGRVSLTADLLDEGTATRSSLEIAAALEALGAELSVSVDWDASALGLQVQASRFEPALELLVELALRPAFPPAEFERKKRERLVALVQEQDDPAILAGRAFTVQVYGPDHPYGAAAGGDLRSIQALDRDALVRFHEAHYRPAGAFLVVVGDVDPARIIPSLERVFDAWAPAPPAAAAMPASPPRATAAVRVVDRPGAPQSELRIGHAGPARSTEDYFPLVVLNTILGGSFTSRLNTRLREEKGYTYGVRSGFHFRTGPGPFLVSTAVDTRVTADAVADVLREISRMRDEPVTASELERARNYLALGLPRHFETVNGIADHIADVLLYRLPDDHYDRYMGRVRAVSADEVQAAALRHLDPAALAVVVAGDHAEVAGPLASLDIAEVGRLEPEVTVGAGDGTAFA